MASLETNCKQRFVFLHNQIEIWLYVSFKQRNCFFVRLRLEFRISLAWASVQLGEIPSGSLFKTELLVVKLYLVKHCYFHNSTFSNCFEPGLNSVLTFEKIIQKIKNVTLLNYLAGFLFSFEEFLLCFVIMIQIYTKKLHLQIF
jgi:hypothetical protein